MAGILAPFQGQLQKLIERIDEELANIETELDGIDGSVDRDVALLIQEYRQGVTGTKLTEEEIRSLYRETLKQKRLTSLERAKSELLKIKGRLSALLYNDALMEMPEFCQDAPHPRVSANTT